MIEKEEKKTQTMTVKEETLKGEIGWHKLINSGNREEAVSSLNSSPMSTGKNTQLPPFPMFKPQSASLCCTLTHRFNSFWCHGTIEQKHMEPQGKVKRFCHAAPYGFWPFYVSWKTAHFCLLWQSDLADLFLNCCGQFSLTGKHNS